MNMPPLPPFLAHTPLANNLIFVLIVGLFIFLFDVKTLVQRILNTIKFVQQHIETIRRLLNAVLVGAVEAVVAYQLDKATGFRLSDTINSSFHFSPSPFTFAAIAAISTSFSRLPDPFSLRGKKSSPRSRRAQVYAFAIYLGVGFAFAVLVPVLLLTRLTGLFGGAIPVPVLVALFVILLIIYCGAAVAIARSILSMLAAEEHPAGPNAESNEPSRWFIWLVSGYVFLGLFAVLGLLTYLTILTILIVSTVGWLGLFTLVGFGIIAGLGIYLIDWLIQKKIPTWVFVAVSVLVTIAFTVLFGGYSQFFHLLAIR
jgi:hypothetical protein